MHWDDGFNWRPLLAKHLIVYHSEKQCSLMLSQLGSAIVVKGAVCYAIMICMRFNIVHIDASILRKHYFSGMQAPWCRHGGSDGKQHLSSIGPNFIDFRNMCIWRQRPWLHYKGDPLKYIPQIHKSNTSSSLSCGRLQLTEWRLMRVIYCPMCVH